MAATPADPSRRAVIVVSYHDGSAVIGVYGPYDNPTIAEGAMKRLKLLPGMGDENWQIFPLHEVATRIPPKERT
jgi:hypothetical protein